MPLTELATSVAVVGSRAASVYGVEMTRAVVRAPRARRACRSSRAGRSASTSRPTTPRCPPTASRPRSWPAASTGSIPQQNRPLLQHLAAEFAVVSEQPPGVGADAAALPGAQPADRRHDQRHRGGRGGPAQRRPQHRRVGREPEPPRDVRAGPGHQLHLAGRQQLPPRGPGHRGHPRRRGARAGRCGGGAPGRPAAGRGPAARRAHPDRADRRGVGAGQRAGARSTRSHACAGSRSAPPRARCAG